MADLKLLRAYAEERHIPILQTPTEKLLINMLADLKPESILEIGTAIGYSGLVMLENSSAHLTTIELDEERFEMAKQNFEPYKTRVTQILGDATQTLKTLTGSFDLVFLDGPKGQYLRQLPDILRLLSPNGHLLADNILYHGWVKGDDYPAHKHRTAILRLREFKKTCEATFEDFQLLEIGDGIIIGKNPKKNA